MPSFFVVSTYLTKFNTLIVFLFLLLFFLEKTYHTFIIV